MLIARALQGEPISNTFFWMPKNGRLLIHKLSIRGVGEDGTDIGRDRIVLPAADSMKIRKWL